MLFLLEKMQFFVLFQEAYLPIPSLSIASGGRNPAFVVSLYLSYVSHLAVVTHGPFCWANGFAAFDKPC